MGAFSPPTHTLKTPPPSAYGAYAVCGCSDGQEGPAAVPLKCKSAREQPQGGVRGCRQGRESGLQTAGAGTPIAPPYRPFNDPSRRWRHKITTFKQMHRRNARSLGHRQPKMAPKTPQRQHQTAGSGGTGASRRPLPTPWRSSRTTTTPTSISRSSTPQNTKKWRKKWAKGAETGRGRGDESRRSEGGKADPPVRCPPGSRSVPRPSATAQSLLRRQTCPFRWKKVERKTPKEEKKTGERVRNPNEKKVCVQRI